MKYLIFAVPLCFILLGHTTVLSQEFEYDKDYFRSPLGIPSLLSANFGELRPDHFHAGIDFKTQGKIGKNIYACADGYISRIKITSAGYGKTIYINHPNGLTTVYAHLNNFNLQLGNYITQKQYELQSYEINLFPEPNELPVLKGDILGLSGNSGYSFGPHLHFEIRNSLNQSPINPLLFDFNILDNVKPKIFSIIIYPKENSGIIDNSIERKRFLVKKINNKYHITNGDTIIGFGKLGFAIEAHDYFNNTHNKCGVYKIKLQINDQLIFAQTIDEVSFSETRYINTHMDYELNLSKKKKVHKCFIEPNNRLSIYDYVEEDGIYNFNDTIIYKINYLVEDVNGNSSELTFFIKPDPSLNLDLEPKDYTANFSFDKENLFDSAGIFMSIPSNALYDSLLFDFSFKENDKFLSPIYSLHNFYTPLHKEFEITILLDSQILKLDTNKLVIALYNKKEEVISVGGEYKNLNITTETRSFGDYFVTIDTIPPEIKPDNFTPTGDLSALDNISFIIKDELSGITKYNGYIDDIWVLFEYDYKNDRLTYFFDEKMLNKKSHTIKIIVEDERGNISEFSSNFSWQKIG